MVMKSSWEKLKGLALSQHQNHKKDDKTAPFLHHPFFAGNGTCLLELSALTDDEQSGNVLRMLSKVQFELQELVDSYRSHIFQITTPSESILNQQQTVEEMKQHCDEKKNVYQGLLAAQKEKERSRSFKGETVSSQKLQAASNEYEKEAICFVFHLKTLKERQTRMLEIRRLFQSAKVRRSEDLYATIENRLTPSNAASYPLPTPLETEYPRGHYIPSSDARFYHSAPMGRSSDLYTKSEIFPSPSNAASYPKLPRFPKAGCLSTQYVHVDDERAYHSAPLEISQDLYATTEIPWTPSNVTAYRLPLGTELPRDNYIPLTDERAKAILGSFRRGQTFGDLQ
ncbi:hypothetical protein MKX01_014006 [Papaver californicum]|nr:hypothetical protein MKX01_014006 [Papaver californicum]